MERISKLETIRDIVRGITGVALDGEMDDGKFRRILISGFGRLDRFNFSKPVLHVFKPEEGETIQAQIETLLKTKSRFSVMFENASVHFILNPSISGAVTAALPTHKTFACIYNVFGVPCMELIKSTQNLPLQMIEYAETDIGVRVECVAYLLSLAILDPLLFCPLIERIKCNILFSL
jgi:hypothetical protein